MKQRMILHARKLQNYLTRRRVLILSIVAACLLIGAVGGPHFFFGDEHDNLLGGQLLAHGGVLYRDYFSHHMPLAYFVAAPFMAVFGTHLILVKMAFGIAMALWTLIISRHFYRHLGLMAWAVFVAVLILAQTSVFANMLLAETLVGYALCHMFVLFFFRNKIPFSYRTVATYAVLAAIPILSSASYVGISLAGYAMLLVHGWSWMRPQKTLASLRRLTASAAIAITPYALLLAYLLINGAFRDFKFQAFTFNELYYSRFTDSVSPDGPFYSLLGQLTGTWAGLERVLLEPHTGLPLLATVFTLGLIIGLPVWFRKGNYVTFTVAAILLVLSTVRTALPNVLQNGTAFALSDTRIGTPVALLGLSIFVLLWAELRTASFGPAKRLLSDHARIAKLSISGLLVVIGLISAGHFLGAFQDLHANSTLVTSRPTAYHPEYIIDSVNKPGDTYWIGPADFYSQIQIKSTNASSYRFFLPWHGACASCVNDLLADFNTNQPTVIYFDQDAKIWNTTARQYAKPVGSYIDKHYFKAQDPRLRNYYFKTTDKPRIENQLKKLGYEL